ncbi:MAG: sensor histidine kinase N-terminal domain-containing protein [Betaproteobacteria bacterium]|nr:sensor histidine kinase N-terminal domain-containing protein [Betaproteobacteria bacterium]
MAEPDGKAPRAGTSLFGEMFDWMIVPFLMIWPLTTVLTYLLGLALANDAFDQALAQRARAVAELIDWPSAEADARLGIDLSTLLADEDAARHLLRVDRLGGGLLLGDDDLPDPAAATLPRGRAIAFQSTDVREQPMRVARLTIASPLLAAPVVVQLAEQTHRRSELARGIFRSIVVPQLVVIPLMVLLMWLGLKRGTRPLLRLRQALLDKRAGDLAPLDAKGQPEEVVPLVHAFNDMLARAEREGEAQRRFIANAAHQLRTPLAGVRLQAELAARQSDPAALREAMARIAEGTERTAHLVNQLLSLARSESGAPLAFAPCDLGHVARAALGMAFPAAQARQIALSCDAPDDSVPVMGHAELLQELAFNLIDNAVRYTPAGGAVNVRVTGSDAPELVVADNGPGIPEAERALVFERFYRAVGTGGTGSGIGLAIVKEIATRHGATVDIGAPDTGTGAVFRVRFPRQSDSKP